LLCVVFGALDDDRGCGPVSDAAGHLVEGVAVVGEPHRLRADRQFPTAGESPVQGVEPLGLEVGGVLVLLGASVDQHELSGHRSSTLVIALRRTGRAGAAKTLHGEGIPWGHNCAISSWSPAWRALARAQPCDRAG